MMQGNKTRLQVGPYMIETKSPLDRLKRQFIDEEESASSIQELGHLKTYTCYKGEMALVAKIISRDMIGASGKRKHYEKWNTQVKHLTEQSNAHVLRTLEVIRNKQQYILIQERDPEKTVSLAEYIHNRVSDVDPKKQTKFLSPRQLNSIIAQIVTAFEAFSVKQKLVHNRLDLHSVFISETDGEQLRVWVDTSEFDGISKLLKQPKEVGKSEKSSNSYEQFKRNKKVCQQRDIQAFGQIVFSLLVHTDLEAAKECGQLLADLVQNCSFKFTNWQHVQSHVYFESLEELTMSDKTPSSTEVSSKKFEEEEAKEIVDNVENVPLNDSITYEELADSQPEESPQKDNFLNEVAHTFVEHMTASQSGSLMENLEKLLETGYAEMIQSELLSQGDDMVQREELQNQEEKKSPFPTGMSVFDDTNENDDFEVLGVSEDEEEFGEYEVICASEMQSIPAQPEQIGRPRAASDVIGQGAQFMMKTTSKLFGSLWSAR